MCSSGASVNVWTFLIVVFESLNCPQCEKMDLKIIQSLLERVQICKNAGKLQNLQNVEDLSEEQCSVQLFRTNKGLMNNQHKTKEQSWIIQVTSHSIKNQGFPNFWRGFENSIFLSKCKFFSGVLIKIHGMSLLFNYLSRYKIPSCRWQKWFTAIKRASQEKMWD